MIVVADTSVAIKWVVSENQSQAAHNLLASECVIVAPDFLLVESINTIWKKYRRGEIPFEDIDETFSTLKDSIVCFIPILLLIPRIMALSKSLDHPAYDCVYLATAEQLDAIVVTADSRFYECVSKSPHQNRISWIENFYKTP